MIEFIDISYTYPVNFRKSGEEKNGRIPIEIIPNEPTKDRVNDRILLKAFNNECIEAFLHDGYIDWDHKSILGKTELEKSEAIIGQPEELFIDNIRQLPICNAFLFAKNPYVMKAILPALEAGSNVFGASVGGKILQKSIEEDPITKNKINNISKISLRHIAITKRQTAIHQNTLVSLRKSCSNNGQCKEGTKCKNCDCKYTYQFDSFNSFIKSFEDDSILKTLEAGTSTSIQGMSGGQNIQTQSLEGGIAKQTFTGVSYEKLMRMLPSILRDLVENNSMNDVKSYYNYLIARGFNKPEALEIIRLLSNNKAQLIKIKLNGGI